jgi:hypothetical protein
MERINNITFPGGVMGICLHVSVDQRHMKFFRMTVLFCTLVFCAVVPILAAGHNILLIGNSLIIHDGPPWDLQNAAKATGYSDYYHQINWYPGSDMMQVWQDKSLMEDPQFHYN